MIKKFFSRFDSTVCITRVLTVDKKVKVFRIHAKRLHIWGVGRAGKEVGAVGLERYHGEPNQSWSKKERRAS